MLKNALKTILDDARALVEQMALDVVIADYQTLVESVIQKELRDELLLLEKTVLLCDESEIKAQFKILCQARDVQNDKTALYFLGAPESYCNALYFNFAKTLYPAANFGELCTILMPTLEKEWIVKLECVQGDGKKRRRLLQKIVLCEIALNDSESCLRLLPLALGSFKRILRQDNHVFIMDNIESFDFKMHAEFHQKLIQENQPLMHGIASFNESLAELYSRLARWNGQGTTIRDVILPIARRMGISGTSAGSGDFASFDGSIAAERFVLYYQALPEPIKSALGECHGHGNNPNITTIAHHIEARECIETAAMQLESVLDNPLNDEILNTTPYMSEEEKMALGHPYRDIKKHEQLIDFNGISKTITLPNALTASFYEQINIDRLDSLVALLISFPSNEYASLFNQMQLDAFDFIEDMKYILYALNFEQREALMRALMMPTVRERADLNSSALLAAFVHSGDQVAIAQLVDNLTPFERLSLLNEKNKDGHTALHLLVFSSEAVKALVELYPNSARTRMKALNQRDHEGATVLHLAGDNHLILKVLIDFYLKYTKGYHPIIEAIMRADDKGRTVLHYAAKDIHSLDMLLKFFRNGDDKAEDDDSVASALKIKDSKGNTVLHYVSKNFFQYLLQDIDALCHLLKSFSRPKDIIELLCQKNHNGEMVLSSSSLNVPTLNKIFELLITLKVSHLPLVTFLTTPIDSETSLFRYLQARTEGLLLLSLLYKRRPRLCFLLSGETLSQPVFPENAEDALKESASQYEGPVFQHDETHRFFPLIRNNLGERPADDEAYQLAHPS